MSDKANVWKWNKFVEIGNTIHKMRGEVRILKAKRALDIADELIDNKFIRHLQIEDQEIFDSLYPRIAEYLDGNAEVIQTAVSDHFLAQHCRSGLDRALYDISFTPKRSGIQSGFTCVVKNGTQSVRYYIKTHQYGPTAGNLRSLSPPDTKELFVYKLLHLIGIGPPVQFIFPYHGTKKTIYIATEDCELILLSDLTKETADMNALLQLDLISRILCLSDCTTNSSNCGQVGDKAMIVDFRIVKQFNGYAPRSIMDEFYNGFNAIKYTGWMKEATGTSNDVKLDIMIRSLLEWKLLECIDRAELEINELVKRYKGELIFDDDLENYVQDIKATIAVLDGC